MPNQFQIVQTLVDEATERAQHVAEHNTWHENSPDTLDETSCGEAIAAYGAADALNVVAQALHEEREVTIGRLETDLAEAVAKCNEAFIKANGKAIPQELWQAINAVLWSVRAGLLQQLIETFKA